MGANPAQETPGVLPDGLSPVDFGDAPLRGPWADLGFALVDVGVWFQRAQEDQARGAAHTAALTARMVESWLPQLVAAAREQGATWQEIGDAQGITRQSAHQKYSADAS